MRFLVVYPIGINSAEMPYRIKRKNDEMLKQVQHDASALHRFVVLNFEFVTLLIPLSHLTTLPFGHLSHAQLIGRCSFSHLLFE